MAMSIEHPEPPDYSTECMSLHYMSLYFNIKIIPKTHCFIEIKKIHNQIIN